MISDFRQPTQFCVCPCVFPQISSLLPLVRALLEVESSSTSPFSSPSTTTSSQAPTHHHLHLRLLLHLLLQYGTSYTFPSAATPKRLEQDLFGAIDADFLPVGKTKGQESELYIYSNMNFSELRVSNDNVYCIFI